MKLTHEIIGNLQGALMFVECIFCVFGIMAIIRIHDNKCLYCYERIGIYIIKWTITGFIIGIILSIPILIAILPGFIDG